MVINTSYLAVLDYSICSLLKTQNLLKPGSRFHRNVNSLAINLNAVNCPELVVKNSQI